MVRKQKKLFIVILQKGNILQFTEAENPIEEIPKGVWSLKYREASTNLYCVKETEFTLPDKLYALDTIFIDKVVKSFNKGQKSLGVLLSGLKGSGKTLLAKKLIRELDLPVVLITKKLPSDLFISWLSSIKQPLVVFIDEFEKIFATKEEQQVFLPILDGVVSTKKLFLFTSNTDEVNTFLKSRPSRIKYLKNFEGLTSTEVQSIVEDRLENKEYKEGVVKIAQMLSTVSIDTLLTLIDEVNLQELPPEKAIKDLNIQVEHSTFDVLMFHEGKRIVSKINYNPLTSKYLVLSYRDKEDRYKFFEAQTDDFTVQFKEGEYVFVKGETRVIFTPSKDFKFEF